MTRASGISVPLFSLVTRNSWGIGELPDVVPFCRWAAEAGQSLVQILPVMELPEPERSPYSALTSFALDPTYIACRAFRTSRPRWRAASSRPRIAGARRASPRSARDVRRGAPAEAPLAAPRLGALHAAGDRAAAPAAPARSMPSALARRGGSTTMPPTARPSRTRTTAPGGSGPNVSRSGSDAAGRGDRQLARRRDGLSEVSPVDRRRAVVGGPRVWPGRRASSATCRS